MTAFARSLPATSLALAWLALPSLAGVHVVDQHGLGNFATISDAVSAAADGDSIFVRGGQYFDSIHVDGKSLSIMAQDPTNPPWIVADFGPEVFLVENLAADQQVLLDHLILSVDGFYQNLSAYKGSLTVRDCEGAVRVQGCELRGADAMCAAAGGANCNQLGALHVSNCEDAVFVDCTISAGYAICWEDAEGTVSCGGVLDPALVVDGATTRVALHDCYVRGAAGRYPQDPDLYDGWDGGPAAVVTDSFVFASNTVFEGGAGSDAKESPQGVVPGNGGDGGVALSLTNATFKELNSVFLGGVAGAGGDCPTCNPPITPGDDGAPGVTLAGCCVESLNGAVRGASLEGNQLLPGALQIQLNGVPGDQVEIAFASESAFLYQPQRLGVFSLGSPFDLLGGGNGVGVIPASGELDLTIPLPPGPGTSDYLLNVQPIFTSASGERVLGAPHRVLQTDACETWVQCHSTLNSTGVMASIGATGTPSIAANDIMLVARHMPHFEMGMFFYGFASTEGWNPVGDGNLCVALPLHRLPPALQSDGFGTVARPLDLNAAPANAGAGLIQSGQRVYFQYMYRDSASTGAGFNFSQSVVVEYCP